MKVIGLSYHQSIGRNPLFGSRCLRGLICMGSSLAGTSYGFLWFILFTGESFNS